MGLTATPEVLARRQPASILNFEPSVAQMRIFSDPARHRVVVAGRRFGKTTEALLECIINACQCPGSLNWYVATTRIQAKDIAWEPLKAMLGWQGDDDTRRPPIVRRWSEAGLWIKLVNGARIALHGAENFEALRGRGLLLAVLDEYADMDPGVWTVIRPQLGDWKLLDNYGRLGRALFIGTPRGYNHFKERWDDANEEGSRRIMEWRKGQGAEPEWSAHRYTSLQGGNIPPQEIAAARRDLTPRDFRQEYEATFESIEGRVLHAFVRELMEKGNLDHSIHDPGEQTPLLIGMDFNVNPMCATVSSRVRMTRTWGIQWECHTWKEYVVPNANTETLATQIRKDFPSRQIIVFPDPTAGARSTSAPMGVTDESILRSKGFTVYKPGSGTYRVADKYNTFNGMCCNAAGARRLVVHPTNCKNLVNAADGLCYKAGTNLPEKGGTLDFTHITDAEGYMLLGAFPIGGKIGGVQIGEVVY